jgi:hypothetical protein
MHLGKVFHVGVQVATFQTVSKPHGMQLQNCAVLFLFPGIQHVQNLTGHQCTRYCFRVNL